MGCTRVQNGSRYTEPADDLASATSCKEAVDIIVDAIKRACEDVGNASGDDFVTEGDIVRSVFRYHAGSVRETERLALACRKHSVQRASMQRWNMA